MINFYFFFQFSKIKFFSANFRTPYSNMDSLLLMSIVRLSLVQSESLVSHKEKYIFRENQWLLFIINVTRTYILIIIYHL